MQCPACKLTRLSLPGRRKLHGLVAGVALVLGFGAQAQVTIDRAWVRSTVPNQTSSGAFMRLKAQQDVQLTGARSSAAGVVEVHEMRMDGDIMKMRPVGSLPLKAGQVVELKSGGYHLMMMDLKRQLKSGEVVQLTLDFKMADGRLTKAEVQAVVAFTAPTP